MPLGKPLLRQSSASPHVAFDPNRIAALNTLIAGNRQMDENNFSATVDPKYDWALKAVKAGSNTAQLNQQTASAAAAAAAAQASAAANNQFAQQLQGLNGGGGGGVRAGGFNLKQVLGALGAQESGGNWGAVNPTSGAMGKWQVMPSNIAGEGGWDMTALGRNVTNQQFLNTPAIQRAIVRRIFGDYMRQHGVRGALSAWYSGDPNKWNDRTPQGDYPSIRNYVLQVLARLNG